MARSIWKGSISFGLVHIPVTLYSAESRPDINLHLLDSRDRHRVRYQRVNEETGEEVPWDAIVRGYEYEDGKFVLLSDEEMEQVKAEASKTVEITDFVHLDEIDPVYFDKPYFLVPDKKQKTAMKGYALLRETLRKTGMVGIAKVVIRTREYLTALMVRDDMLVLNVLRFHQELKDASEHELPGEDLKELKISPKEIEMATQLVEAMAGPWEPERYEDSYRTALMEWIDKKIEEGNFEVSPERAEEEPKAPKGKVVDLMSYLKKSVESAREERGKKPAAKKSAKKTPAKKTAAKRKTG